MKIKLTIIDEHKLIREGIELGLDTYKDIVTIIKVKNVFEFLQISNANDTDIVILGINSNEKEELESITVIRNNFQNIKIIVLSNFYTQSSVISAIQNRANAYLVKDIEINEIYKAIIVCIKNEYYFNSFYNKAISNAMNLEIIGSKSTNLNPVESKILQFIWEEKTTEEISGLLCLKKRRIDDIRRGILFKTGTKNLVGLIKYAINNKIFYFSFLLNQFNIIDVI